MAARTELAGANRPPHRRSRHRKITGGGRNRVTLGPDAVLLLSLQCSPLHGSTPLYPIKTLLEHALLMRSRERIICRREAESNSRTAGAAHAGGGAHLSRTSCFRSRMRGGEIARECRADQGRDVRDLIEIVARLAARGPLLIIVEDVQWIDPSSLELLDHLISRIVDLPVLLITTARPTFTALQPVGCAASDKDRALSLGPSKQRLPLSSTLPASSRLSPAEVRHIIDRAEGNPFFLEELTRSIWSGRRPKTRDPVAVTATNCRYRLWMCWRRALINPDGKQIAQVASAIGRRFSLGLLQQATQLDDETLDSGLAGCMNSGSLLPNTTCRQRSYSFRHALLQQSAYDSMLKATRQRIHRQLADVLETTFAEPEILARHFTEAGLPREAIAQLQLAGERAASRSANLEAISLLQRALSLSQRT